MTVEKLRAEHYEEFLDLVDLVFCQNLRKVHFREDLPYLFGADDRHMGWQYGCRNDQGKLVAVIGVIPYVYKVGEETFNARVLTNVATHSRYMGQGYMQKILDRVFRDLKEEGVDFLLLHGHRERYRFSGFEMAGMTTSALYKSYNIPSRLKRGEKFDFAFEEVKAEDTEKIRFCKSLFDREAQHFDRPLEEFMLFQQMWQGKLFLIYNAQGAEVGYLNYYDRFGGPGIRELLLTCPECAARVIYSFMQYKNIASTPLSFSPFDKTLAKHIYESAEEIHIGQTNRLNLLRPERFICACLELKRKSGAYMPEGKLVVDCQFGRLRIENNGAFTVTRTEEQPDIVITEGEIYSFLFGPAPSDWTWYSETLKEKAAWFPVPFFIHNTDLY